MSESTGIRFIADENLGKLARLLRLLGFDTVLFKNGSDRYLVELAMNEKRIILTRDTRIQERRVVLQKQVKLLLLSSDRSIEQIQQVLLELNLQGLSRPFSLCLECNRPLFTIDPAQVSERVPPYVFKTQQEYVECINCRRIYWKGTHWRAMSEMLAKIDKQPGRP